MTNKVKNFLIFFKSSLRRRLPPVAVMQLSSPAGKNTHKEESACKMHLAADVLVMPAYLQLGDMAVV